MEREVERKRLYGKFRKSAGKQQKGKTESRKKTAGKAAGMKLRSIIFVHCRLYEKKLGLYGRKETLCYE